MEVIELNDLENIDDVKPSVNFGSGIELLMNDKKKGSNNNISIDIGELDSLENELNELTSGAKTTEVKNETKTLSGFASNLFGFGSNSTTTKITEEPEEQNTSNIGQATRESIGNTKTWDGFTKINEIPINDYPISSNNRMNEREKRRKKLAMIKKLEEWHEKGFIKSNNHYTMESSYEEIEDDYETALEDKRKKESIKLHGWWLMSFINTLEYVNSAFNPFDLNLDGWGEQVSEDIDSYEEIFGELYEKYKGGKLAPEISLLLKVGFSAAVLNFSNKALSSATPAFNDVIKQSPELMKMFTNATVNAMSQQSQGFAFANNIMQDQASRPRGPPPPAPIETKTQPPPQRPGSMMFTETPMNRPDINASRTPMFKEKGVELNSYEDIRSSPTPIIKRNEMKGPQSTDIDNLLAGLKTKTVDIHETKPQTATDEDSMISISSLKELQNTNAPKKSSRRRNTSDKNTIALDI